MMTGIYIHFPFCVKKCNYCDFYSITGLSLVEEYIGAMGNQTAGFPSSEVDSIYIGGGTPSLLEGKQAKAIVDMLKKRFSVKKESEITIEVNPAGCSSDRLREFRDAGINRLSVGIQSMSDKTLKTLGRTHTGSDALKTLQDAKNAGFFNISADIMLGLPDESEDDIKKTVEPLIERGVTHISAYILKLAEGTPMGDTVPDGIPDEDGIADIYMYASGLLESNGYMQYEISNFAQDTYESRHNMKYWNCENYIGMGAGAYSSLDSNRYHFPPDIYEYIRCFKNPSTIFNKGFVYDGEVTWDEYFMLRLRTKQGISFEELKKRFYIEPYSRMEHLLIEFEKKGYTKLIGNTVKLTRKGMLLSNSVISSLLVEAEKI